MMLAGKGCLSLKNVINVPDINTLLNTIQDCSAGDILLMLQYSDSLPIQSDSSEYKMAHPAAPCQSYNKSTKTIAQSGMLMAECNS